MKKSILFSLLCISGVSLHAEGDDLVTTARTCDLEKLTFFFEKNKPNDWTCHQAFQGVSTAFQEDSNKQESSLDQKKQEGILMFLLKNISTKSDLLKWACSRGKDTAVKVLLEDDADSCLMASIANHIHILEARDAGHTTIAKMVKSHLIKKGYGYAGTIDLE